MRQQTTEVVIAVTAILGSLGAILRYVLRLAVTVDRAARTGADTVSALREHAAESARVHERMADQLGDHTTRLAVLESQGRSS